MNLSIIRLNLRALFSLLFLFIIPLGGCVAVNAYELQKSKTAYKKCLIENPNNIKVCEALKAAFDADAKTLGAVTPIYTPPTPPLPRLTTTCMSMGPNMMTCN